MPDKLIDDLFQDNKRHIILIPSEELRLPREYPLFISKIEIVGVKTGVL